MAELGAIEEECLDERKDEINLSVTECDMNDVESIVSVGGPSDPNVAEVPPAKDALTDIYVENTNDNIYDQSVAETSDLSVAMQSDEKVAYLRGTRVSLADRYVDLRLEIQQAVVNMKKLIKIEQNVVETSDQSVAETSEENVDQILEMRCPEMKINDQSVARPSDEKVADVPQTEMCLAGARVDHLR